MYTDEQDKLIELFNKHTDVIYKKWTAVIEVIAPGNIHLENIFRKLYSRLAPEEPVLPPSWSYRLTVVTQRGDGIQGTNEVLLMPDGFETRTFELLVKDKVYVVTKESDSQAEDHIWEFSVHAPTVETLEIVVKELKQLIPPISERKAQILYDETKEVESKKTIEESKKKVHPKLFMTIEPTGSIFLSNLTKYLENLSGITNLRNDFFYNIAECYCEYDEVHFDFKKYRFSIYEQNENDEDVWKFYVEAECPKDIISEIEEYCKLFWRKI